MDVGPESAFSVILNLPVYEVINDMKRFFDYKSIFRNRPAQDAPRSVRSLRKRLSRFESLEERTLLSVTPAEYAEIRASYAEFDLPESMDELNVIEITADQLGSAQLKAAVEAAGASAGDDLLVVRTAVDAHTIGFDSAADEVSVTFDYSEYGVLSIVGYGTTALTLDANSCCRLLTIGSSAKANLGNITLTGGSAAASSSNAGYGGGLYNAGRLTASSVTVAENTSSYCGGGIFNSGQLKLYNAEVTNNSAVSSNRASGGGIYSSGTVTAENLLIADNIVSGSTAYGGGVYLWNGKFTVTGGTVSGNSAGVGGGFYLFGSSSIKYSLSLRNSILTGNSAESSASAEICRYNSKGTISASSVLTDWTDWDSSSSVYAYDSSLPLFTNTQAGLYTLPGDSQAVDRGNNSFVTLSTDLSEGVRIYNGIVDLGAYEYQPSAKPDITDVSVSGWSGYYDGASHTITVTDPHAASDVITYFYGGEQYDTPPAFTEVGSYTVSVTVQREGYNDWSGSAVVAISAKPDITDVSVTGWSGVYDGQAHTVTLTDPYASTDTITYTYAGQEYETAPAFTEEGVYPVSVTVEREGYNSWSGSATVTILPVSTDLVVTTNLDTVDETDGFLSLREAITLVESGAAESNVIVFSPSVFTGGSANTITLTQGKLAVTKSMTIDASALDDFVTIDADGKSRVFEIDGGEDASVELIGLTVTGGATTEEAGAGIYLKSGSLTLTHSVVTHNVAETGTGGGVYIEGGALSAANTEFSANTAAIGAGVYAAGGAFTAVNCTIAANAATNYGGGVANWSSALLHNTIVANNFGYVNNSDWFGLGVDPESSNNIIGFDAEFVTAPEFDEEGNILNLESLDLTLSVSSWGIDRGLNSAVAESADLAGNTRIVQSWAEGATVDIGAYEYQSAFSRDAETASTTVTTLLDLVDDTDGLISLREAILYAEDGETIHFAETLAGGTISLSESALMVEKQLEIDASALEGGVILDGNSKSTVMIISSGSETAPTVIKGLTLTGGNSYDGGAILSSGSLRVEDSVLTASSATYGSAIFNFRGNLQLDHVTVSKNTTGGAVYSYYGTLTVSDSSFAENSGSRGGALYLSNGTATVSGTSFTGNRANYGGAIQNVSSTLTISDSTISGGGSYYGGAICNYGVATLVNTVVSGNNAYYNGGGIYNYLGTLNATNTLFYGNTGGYGGAICNDEGVLTTVNCTLTGNESNYGGGIFAHGVSSEDDSQTYVITLCNTIIASNSAVYGADIHKNNEYGTINSAFSLSSFTDWSNTATNYEYDSTRRLFRDPGSGDYQLASGGQAIDVGGNAFVATITTDLNGDARIVNSVVDLGAYEFQRNLEAPSAVVTTEQDVVDLYDGLISLREAIAYVESGQAGGDTVSFDEYMQGKTITLNASLGALKIAEAITVDASALRSGVTVSGGGQTRVFEITGGSTLLPVVFDSIQVTGGAAENGAGIWNDGVLVLRNSLVAGNTASNSGGGLWNQGELTALNTTIAANTALSGAGVWSKTERSAVLYKTVFQNSIIAENTLSEGGSGNADIGYADTDGAVNAFYTLSSFTDWTNADDPDVVNYSYDASLPLFADKSSADYALAGDSQAIDLGDNGYVSFLTDLAGNFRIVNSLVDLGAYEFLYNDDPGDTLETAETVVLAEGSYLRREMIGNGLYGDKDVDLYAINITDEDLATLFTFTVTASEDGESLDTLIRVFDAEGTPLGSSTSSPILSWTPNETGRFYFGISAAANNEYDPASTDGRPSGETGTYKFTIYSAARTPITSVSLSETSPCVGQNISVSVEPEDALVTYQWVRGTDPDTLEAIDGATAYYYEVSSGDVGYYIGVVVTGYGTSVGTLTAVTETAVPEFEKSLVVTTLSDVADSSDGLVSLREAIAYAETGETVTFDSSLNGGEIILGDYALVVSKRINIDASSLTDGITISADGRHRVMMVTAGELGSTVNLTNLTISGGNAVYGGGIYNSGYLELIDVTVSDCTAYYGGGIYNQRDLNSLSPYTTGYVGLTNSTVTSCTASNGGGGVWNEMGIVVTKYVKILSNTAQIGGGFYNYYGSCSAEDTLIASNSATRYGGGLCIDQGTFFFTGITVTANSAAYGGGVYNYSSADSFPYTTEYYNSLIVENAATRSGADFYSDGNGAIKAYSVMSSFTDWTNEDPVFFVYDSTKPMFTDAGTGDFSLAAGSQAIDIGTNTYSPQSVDIAGNPRISHEIVDLGAYEYQFSETTPLESVTLTAGGELSVGCVLTAAVLPEEAQTSGSVTWAWYRGPSLEEMTLISGAEGSAYTVSADDQECYIMVSATGTGNYTGTVTAVTSETVPVYIDPLVVTTAEDVIDAEDDLVSLREAILAADNGDVITFADDLADSTITLNAELGGLVIRKSISIDASSLCNTSTLAPRLTVDANAKAGESRRVFTLTGAEGAPITVSIIGLQVTGGRVEVTAAGDENVQADGGGIYASFADLTLDCCTVTGNAAKATASAGSAFATGGGICLANGALTLSNVTFTANSLYAYSNGGVAETLGGGIHANGTVTISQSTISGHSASAGGGIYLEAGSLTISGSAISNNSCHIESDADDNVAAYGGGIFASSGEVEIRTSTIRANSVETKSVSGTANAHGGGIYIDAGAVLVMEDVILTANSVSAETGPSTAIALGGGIFSSSSMTLVDVLIAENYVYAAGEDAESAGGGAALYAGTLTARGVTIAANDAMASSEGTATEAGGGVYLAAGSVTFRNSILAQNTGSDGADLFRRSASAANAYRTLSGYTDWSNAGSEGVQNFVYDAALPLFNGAYAEDYTLAASSQAIDLGNNGDVYYSDGSAIVYDLARNKRIVSGIVDLGAYEYQTGELEILDVPTGLTARISGSGEITVSWNGVENASGYEVAWKPKAGSAWQTRDVSALSLTVDGLTIGETAEFMVRALGDGIIYGDSAFSDVVEKTVAEQTVLSVPQDLDALATGSTSALMVWGVSQNASGYELAWKADSWPEWMSAVKLTRGMTVGDLPDDEAIYFKVRALGDGEYYLDSDYSEEVEVWLRDEIVLDSPAILTGAGNYYVSYGANRHKIVWSDIENASGYELSYSADGGSTWTTVAADETDALVQGLPYGAVIQYRVRALGTGIYTNSPWSAVSAFNVCPMDINGDGDISGGDRVILADSWLSGEGEAKYRYYADIDGNGDVSGADRSFLAVNWLDESGDDDLVYPPAKCLIDAVFAESSEDLLDLDIFGLWK